MPAIPHDPKADINLIRTILRSGYEDGFPVLKEMLQNADDAGGGDLVASASTVVLLLAPNGLPGATHPLLNGRPGLCVLNDGDFRESDAICLPMLGLSNKAAEQSSIGKFGIGLKTVFFLTEAFFFFSNRENDWSAKAKACEFVNPWGEEHRSLWESKWADNARTEHHQRFRDLAARTLGEVLPTSPRRFLGIWIPLRESGDALPEVIHNHQPTPTFESIFGTDWRRRLLEFTPLLRHVRFISVRKLKTDGHVEEIFSIGPHHLETCRFIQIGTGSFQGEMELRNGRDDQCSLVFKGHECHGKDDLQRLFQSAKNWPRQAVFGETTDKPERATPHGAVVFTRRSKTAGKGRLQIQHAVFLPLGEAEQTPLVGAWDYSVFLHGFYFVDSSRRHIEKFDPQEDLRDADVLSGLSEAELRRAWNCRLTAELVAPGFVTALAGFVEQTGASDGEVRHLVEALAKSSLLRSYARWLFDREQFLFRLGDSGQDMGKWETASAEKTVFAIPEPDFPPPVLFKAFSRLRSIAVREVVTFKDWLPLSSRKPKSLTDDLLGELLGVVEEGVFERAPECRYLLDLIPTDSASRPPDSPLTRAIVGLANSLIARPLPEEAETAELWKQFFKRLPTGALVRLTEKSAKANPEIARVLAETKMPVAMLWQDFHDADGSGSIPWTTLLPLLQSLGGLHLADDAVRQRSAIVVQLLDACEALPPGWTDAIAKLPLFEACTPSGAGSAASFAELQTASGNGLLFTGGKEWAADLAKAAPTLRPLLIAQDMAEVLDLGAATCDAAACVSLLRTAPRLAEDFTSRKPLFERLLKNARPNDADVWAALRCLIHGQITHWKQTASLFREGNDQAVFVVLTRMALDAAGTPWRLIPKRVADQLTLNADLESRLGLVSTSASHVEALVKEVGPESVDCEGLSREDCDVLLQQFKDVDVLRGLNIHDTSDHSHVRIGKRTYVDDGTFTDIPLAFDTLVTRISDNPNYARFTCPDGANRLVEKLNWEAVIKIALDQDQPANWAKIILTAIGRLGNLRSELKTRVQEVAWLPRTVGIPVAAKELLHVSDAEAELDRLPDDILTGRIPLLRLAQSVREHERFDTFKSTILPPAKDALESLANLLKPHPAWSTGLSGEWTVEQVADWVHAVGDAPEGALPVAPLIKSIYAKDKMRELLPAFLQGLGGRLTETAYADILEYSSGVHEGSDAEKRQRLEGVFLRYLVAINAAGAEFSRLALAGESVRLMSGAGSWKAPSQLTFPTNGVIPDDLLCQRHADALPSLQQPHPHEGDAAAKEQEVAQQFEDDLSQTSARLSAYFAPWIEFVPREVVGAFLCVLGDAGGVRNLAEQFLGQRSVEGTRAEIAAKATQPALIVQALGSHRFACVVHGESTRSVSSVLGNSFAARLGGDRQTIFFGSGAHAFPVAGNWTSRRLHLLAFDLAEENNAPEKLANLLRASAEAILGFVFCENGINLQPLWDALTQPSQLHIRIAQNRVVEAAQSFLRQVGAHHTNEIRQVLKDWDTADRRRAEAEENNRQVPLEVQHQLTEAKKRLRALLAGHQETQQSTLAAVRSKIAQYQYDPNSVPFELWQNADDALVESSVRGFDCEWADALGFVVEGGDTTVAFGHWGRLINKFQGAEGRNFRECGFDQDLEKMVVQSISDKGASSQPDAAVTGKFGLGFKSVFLVSDAPEVLSGSVDFVIRGGIYPVRLNEAQREALEATLKAIAPDDWRRGTIIRLPLRANGAASADAVLSLFRRLAPLLVVFSRRLRRLRFRSQNQEDAELFWNPKRLADGIDVGALELLEGGGKNALVLSRTVGTDRVQFLLGLNADGFIPLPDDVPVFWVTAPTRATPDYGFAVNGPFEPDVGRVQLALQSEKNRQLAGDLAGVLATRLKLLGERSSTAWPALRDELKLATGANAYDFWISLWNLLGKHFAAKCRKEDESPVAALARRILWESEGDGLQWFYRDCAALPTGLWGDYRTLTRLRELRHVAAGALDRESVFRAVSGWTIFQQRVAIGAICSGSQVASVLERLGVSLREVEAVHLTTVVEWELGKEKRADPELATHLGGLITPDFMTGLEKGQAGEREESEHKKLMELLRDVSVQAADGSWHKLGKLVAAVSAPGVEKDEVMRAAFAPRECQLNPAYTGTALQFFLASRPRLEAGVEQMAEWVLKASDQGTQVAALHYLLGGAEKLRHALAEKLRTQHDAEKKLRTQRDAEKWLWTLESFDWFKTEFSDDQRHELLAHVLKLFEVNLRELTGTGSEQRPETQPPLKHIWTVAELWQWWEQQGKPMGDYTLEGEANWELFHGGRIPDEQGRKEELKRLLLSVAKPDGGHDGNSLWYRLFGYACLVSAGRHTTELRQFWLGRLNPRQFWERTSRGDFSAETREIFEQAVTAQFSEAAYYWRRVFYDLRKVHRMVCVNNFPFDLMRLVDEGHGQHLREFLSSGRLPYANQQRWVGTFGQSSDAPLGFIIRELVRLEVITDESVRPSAFFVCRPVLRALSKIGRIDDDDEGAFSGEDWLAWLAKDPVHGPLLMPYYDIPLLHMGVTHRGDRMPVLPR